MSCSWRNKMGIWDAALAAYSHRVVVFVLTDISFHSHSCHRHAINSLILVFVPYATAPHSCLAPLPCGARAHQPSCSQATPTLFSHYFHYFSCLPVSRCPLSLPTPRQYLTVRKLHSAILLHRVFFFVISFHFLEPWGVTRVLLFRVRSLVPPLVLALRVSLQGFWWLAKVRRICLPFSSCAVQFFQVSVHRFSLRVFGMFLSLGIAIFAYAYHSRDRVSFPLCVHLSLAR